MLLINPLQTTDIQAKRRSKKRNVINLQSPFLSHSKEVGNQDKHDFAGARELAENHMQSWAF